MHFDSEQEFNKAKIEQAILNGEVIFERGEKGDKGDKGDAGEKGEQGIQGKQGIQGEPGKDGKDGIDGKDGVDGKDGIDGVGIPGKDGKTDTKEVIKEVLKELDPKISQVADSVSFLPRTLDSLYDVNAKSPTNQQALIYDKPSKKWIPGSVGGGSPGGSPTQIQFNNSGAFGGVSHSTVLGDDIGLGNTGSVDNPFYITSQYNIPALITISNEATGDLSQYVEVNGITNFPSWIHTGTGQAAVYGMDATLAIKNTSTGPYSFAVGLFGSMTNYGSGDIGTLQGLNFTGNNAAVSNVTYLSGLTTFATNSGTVTGYASAVDAYTTLNAGTIGESYGVSVQQQGSSVAPTNQYGLKIFDMTEGSNNWAIKTGLGLVDFGDEVLFAASTTSRAMMNLKVGSAPSSPADGDVWLESNTNTGLKIRINGVTKTITLS